MLIQGPGKSGHPDSSKLGLGLLGSGVWKVGWGWKVGWEAALEKGGIARFFPEKYFHFPFSICPFTPFAIPA